GLAAPAAPRRHASPGVCDRRQRHQQPGKKSRCGDSLLERCRRRSDSRRSYSSALCAAAEYHRASAVAFTVGRASRHRCVIAYARRCLELVQYSAHAGRRETAGGVCRALGLPGANRPLRPRRHHHDHHRPHGLLKMYATYRTHRGPLLIALALISTLCAIAAMIAGDSALNRFDHAIAANLQPLLTAPMLSTLVAITYLGDRITLTILTIVVAGLLLWRGNRT